MRYFKYACGILAVVYLLFALLPTDVIVSQSTAPELWPAWLGRGTLFAEFLLLAVAFYGMHARKPIYWTLIPILVILYFLCVLIPALWSLIALSLPWTPFIIIMVLFLIGTLVFYVWWRKQRGYFT